MDALSQLELLYSAKLSSIPPDQQAGIVKSVIHFVMHPYFLEKPPEHQEKYREQYLRHLQIIEDYCLREYILLAEPRLTLDFIRGLHRHLFFGIARMAVKSFDGVETFMIPGEFKTSANVITRQDDSNVYLATTSPEHVANDLTVLLGILHNNDFSIFQRYFQFLLDFSEIHPFLDGNGKIALMLGDLFLLKQGVQPPYFAKYRWEHGKEIFELAEQHSKDPSRDVSRFFPLMLQAYRDIGFSLQNDA